jgi:hypothetical protein
MHRLSEILSSKAINTLQLDELGDNPAQIGPRSAGQSGGSQGFSPIAEANEESVEELADTDQAFESAAVEESKTPPTIPHVPPTLTKNTAARRRAPKKEIGLAASSSDKPLTSSSTPPSYRCH